MDDSHVLVTARRVKDDGLLPVLVERAARLMRLDAAVQDGDLPVRQLVLQLPRP